MSKTNPEKLHRISLKHITIDPAYLSKILTDRRKHLGLSLRDLAAKSGVATATIHRLEQGNYMVQLDRFIRVMDALELLPNNAFQIKGASESTPPTALEKEIAELVRTGDAAAIMGKIAKMLSDRVK